MNVGTGREHLFLLDALGAHCRAQALLTLVSGVQAAERHSAQPQWFPPVKAARPGR